MARKIAARFAAVLVPVAATGAALVAPAHADAKTVSVPVKGAQCGVNTPDVVGLAAGVEELTAGTLDCAVKGAGDVLGSLADTLGNTVSQN